MLLSLFYTIVSSQRILHGQIWNACYIWMNPKYLCFAYGCQARGIQIYPLQLLLIPLYGCYLLMKNIFYIFLSPNSSLFHLRQSLSYEVVIFKGKRIVKLIRFWYWMPAQYSNIWLSTTFQRMILHSFSSHQKSSSFEYIIKLHYIALYVQIAFIHYQFDCFYKHVFII